MSFEPYPIGTRVVIYLGPGNWGVRCATCDHLFATRPTRQQAFTHATNTSDKRCDHCGAR